MSSPRPPQDPRPEDAPVRKRYTTVIRNDGSFLPIEERIGRRLIRSLPPDSDEARRLLRLGRVGFFTSSGARLEPAPLAEVLARLDAGTRSRLARHRDDPAWRAACRSALEGTRRVRQRHAREV